MCGVDPMSEGLVAYWRMNEGTGKDLRTDRSRLDTTSSGWGNLNWLTEYVVRNNLIISNMD